MISNFKSFGAIREPSAICFGPGVNLILGPNGSGKSNALDALAFAAGVSSDKLRVKSNNQLKNNMHPADPCVVNFFIRRKAVSHQIKCVSKDGTREWKIDGKAKTGAAVTSFLAERGIRLGSSSIIRQGNIMSIASSDANSLSVLVADASGLTSFKEESKRGGLEIAAARKALETINKSVQKLEAASSDVARRMKNVEDREMIEREMIKVVRGIYRHQLCLQQELNTSIRLSDDARSSHKREIEASKLSLIDLLSSVKRLEDVRDSKRKRVKKVVDDLVSVSSLAEARGDHKRNEERREAVRLTSQAEIEGLKLSVSERKGLLDLASEALEREEGILARLSGHQGDDSSLLELKKGAEQRVRGSKEELDRCERKLRGAERKHEACNKTQSELQKQMDLLTLAREEMERMRKEIDSDAACSDESIPLLDLLRMKSESESSSAATAKGRLEALGRSLDAGRGQLDHDSCLVHQCFRFKETARAVPQDGLVKALAAIMGSSLHVTVCTSSVSAQRIIATHNKSQVRSKLRLWPLDTLYHTSDRDEERRVVIRALAPPGSAWIPSDLIEPVDLSYAPAIKRSLGSLVVASTNEIATVLSRKGIESVTLGGIISRHGSISCAFRGASSTSPNEHLLRMKLECMELDKSLRSFHSGGLGRKLKGMMERVERLLSETRGIDSALLEEEMVQARQIAAEAKAEETVLANECLEARRRVLEGDNVLEGIVSLLEDSKRGLDAEGARKRVRVLKEGVAACRVERNQLEEEVLGMEMRIEEIKILLDVPVAPLLHLQAPQSDLLELQGRQKVLEKEEGELAGELREIEQRIASYTVSAGEKEGEIEKSASSLLSLDAEGRQLATRRDRALGETEALLSHLSSEKRLLITGSRGHAVQQVGSEEGLGQEGALLLELEGLKIKEAKLPRGDSSISDADRSIHASRMISLDELRGHQRSLNEAIDSLDVQIKVTGAEALSRNNDSFETIATSFEELCSYFLPTFVCRLDKMNASDASLGLRIQCRRKDNARGGGRGALGESSVGMDILSGGQRTMVAMALLLSAAGQGGKGSCNSVLLLDEVDAALDQSNQATVGALLNELKIQVICVSHNASFQVSTAASHTVHISRGSDGFSAVQ